MGSDPVHLTDAALGTTPCSAAEREPWRTDRRRLSREGSRGSTDPARDEAVMEDKAAGEVPGEVSPLVATEPGATAAVALAMVATTTVDMATAAMGTKKGKLLSQ